jgi:hypothetical protein
MAGPYFEVAHELLAHFRILVVDECCEVVDIIGGLVKIFDGDRIGVSKTNQILEDKSVVFPNATPKNGRQGVEPSDSYLRLFGDQREQYCPSHNFSIVQQD